MTGHYDIASYRNMGVSLRKQILRGYGEDSCIATVRATVGTLRQLRVDVFPLAVQVVVMNDRVYDWAEEHGRFPEKDTEEYPDGGYALAVTRHVVAIAERKWILDFSIDQANREEYGIVLEPLVIPCEETWLRGRGGHFVFRHGRTILYYTAMVGDRWFEESPNWNGDSRPGVEIRERKAETRRVANKRRLIR